jgi:hypothetical protein
MVPCPRRSPHIICTTTEVSRFIDHFVGAFLLNKASRLHEQKASAVLVIVQP